MDFQKVKIIKFQYQGAVQEPVHARCGQDFSFVPGPLHGDPDIGFGLNPRKKVQKGPTVWLCLSITALAGSSHQFLLLHCSSLTIQHLAFSLRCFFDWLRHLLHPHLHLLWVPHLHHPFTLIVKTKKIRKLAIIIINTSHWCTTSSFMPLLSLCSSMSQFFSKLLVESMILSWGGN